MAIIINGHYIEFINNKYVLSLDKNKLSEVGVSYEFYKELCRSIEKTNGVIEDIIAEKAPLSRAAGTKIVVIDCTYSDMDCGVPLVKTSSESGGGGGGTSYPSGSIRTNGQETGSSPRTFAPWSMTTISAHCVANVALFAGHTVTIDNFGTIIGTRMGSGSIELRLNASNTNFTVNYCTMDSNGGKCSWSGRN